MAALTGAQFITMLQARLGQRTDIAAATILLETQMVQQQKLEMDTFYPWFLQYEDTSISTVADQEYVDLPTGFLGFDDEDEWSGIAYQDTNITYPDKWVQLVQDDFNVIRSEYAESDTDKPVKFGLVGSRAYLRPIPDAVYPLRFRFFKAQTLVANDSNTTTWLTNAFDWIMGETGFIFASQYVKDMECAAVFRSMADAARKGCYFETIKRQEAGKQRQQGDD